MSRCLAMTGLVVLGVALAAGCTPLQSSEPRPNEYVLAAPDDGASLPAAALPQPLALATPQVPPGFDGRRIRIRRPGLRLSHIADARWAAALPELIGEYLRRALEARLEDHKSTREADQQQGDHVLEVRITAFEPVYTEGDDARPEVKVALTLALRDRVSGTVAATASAQDKQSRVADKVDAIVAALSEGLGRAFDRALTELADQYTPR